MKSMTGYGRASAALGDLTLAVQVSSVNRKTLDLLVRLPPAWESLEAAVGERVRRVAVRGKVQVDFELGRPGAEGEATWDEVAVERSLAKLEGLAVARGVPFRPTLELLWSVASAHRRAPEAPPPDAAEPVVLETLELALREFAAARAKEGEALYIDLATRLTQVRQQVAVAAERAPRVPAAQREALLQRLRQADLDLNTEDERVLREIALFADRCDVSEELTRCRSHLEQMESLLRSEGDIGRRAEFLLQEIGREVHTLGSKANDLAISRCVLEAKNELERMREQVANVE
jgi:uncharacterized protein (TIGR00255 family)